MKPASQSPTTAIVAKYDTRPNIVVVVVVVTRSDQPKPPAVAIVRQNGLSSASCRASVAVTPMSGQIWWIQVVGGRPLARLHSCEGRSPSLALVQIRRIWFAGTLSLSSRHYYFAQHHAYSNARLHVRNRSTTDDSPIDCRLC